MKKTKGKSPIIYILSVTLASFLLSLLIMFLINDAFALTERDGSTEVYFSENTGLFKASRTLKDEGLIDSRIFFTVYARARGKDGEVKAGSYKIEKTGGYDGILNKICK